VTIARAELWKVGQVKPGDRIRFHPISFEQAQSLEQAQQGSIDSLMPVNAMALAVAVDDARRTPRPPPFSRRYRPRHSGLRWNTGRPGDGYVLIEYGDNVLDLAVRMRIHLLMQSPSVQPVRRASRSSRRACDLCKSVMTAACCGQGALYLSIY
jgi:urea carboxylase